MSVTLAALAAFDVAAVTQMHRYLISRADAQLRNILNLLEPLSQPLKANVSSAGAKRPLIGTAVSPMAEAAAGTGRVPSPDPGDYHVWFMAGYGQTGYVGGNPALGLPSISYQDFISLQSSKTGWTGETLDTRIPIRMMVGKVGDGSLVVTVDLRSVGRSMTQLERILIAGSVAAALIVALGGGWLIRRGLRPIEAMAAQADRITAGDLTDRVAPADTGTEVGRLGAALNGMLARIEASIARTRGQPAAHPAVLRRRQPRAAQPAGLAARQRRALSAAGDPRPARAWTRPCSGSRGKRSGWASWSTTCSGWRASTRPPASSVTASTSPRWRKTVPSGPAGPARGGPGGWRPNRA